MFQDFEVQSECCSREDECKKKKKNYSTPNSLFPIEINIFFKPIPARGRTAALLLVPQPALRMICDYTDNKKPAITSIEKTFMK